MAPTKKTLTSARARWTTLILATMTAAGACRHDSGAADQLLAEQVGLQREVDGLRQLVARLDGGEPLIPENDVAIGIDDQLVSDIIKAQLPISLDVDGYHLDLKDVDVQFNGSPIVRLRGRIALANQPTIAANVSVLGALSELDIHRASSTLRGKIAVDHLTIETGEGIGQFLAGSTLEEVVRYVRLEIKDRLPEIQIPVKVQQSIEFPAQTEGAVRIAGATMPLAATLSLVTAARGRLWIAVHLSPGEIVKTADAPAGGGTQ